MFRLDVVLWPEYAIFVFLIGGIFSGFRTHPAFADDVAEMVLDTPSSISPNARSGLFTSVARAGGWLVAVGEQGRTLLSDDSGKIWRQVKTPTSVTLTDINFFNPRLGWAVGQMGLE